MKIKFLGQNCFLFQYQGKNILSDPFYNFQKEKSGFDISEQKIDYVLITHAHEDHIADVKEVLEIYPEAVVIAQPEVCGYFGHSHFIDLNIGGMTQIEGLKIFMVQASHTSSFPDGSYGGIASGYILRYQDKGIYLSGDTGVMAEMALFSKQFGEIDVAILPIGGHYTMDAYQANFVARELLKTKKVIGCHFDTFPSITLNHSEVERYFAENKTDLILPELGINFAI
ncbi:MAG: metal-dependent hydrolase [Flavobacteriaceae bacterium]|nr:metal-dependent hydrolase [Flavobacteriaceae bacterium]